MPAAEGVFVASAIGVVGDALPAGVQKQAIDEMAQPFTAKYGYPPPQFAADGYTGVKLLAAAITEGEEHRRGEDPRGAGRADAHHARTAPTTTAPTDHSGLTAEYISINVVKDGKLQATDWARRNWPRWRAGDRADIA